MRHLDLFSGIGGFAYAAKEVWKDDYETVAFCDIDRFCQAVLRLRFPGVPIYGDIKELNVEIASHPTIERLVGCGMVGGSDSQFEGERRPRTVERCGEVVADSDCDGFDGKQTEVGQEHIEGTDGAKTGTKPMEYDSGRGGTAAEGVVPSHSAGDGLPEEARQIRSDDGKVLSEDGERLRNVPHAGDCDFSGIDLITGGFPCQPFSAAGKRRGTGDERHLWPEMLETIRLVRPRWVLGENVRGLLNIESGVVFEQVCLDLEALGYSVRAFLIPAAGVNAPHRRDRVWIVGYNASVKRCGKDDKKSAGRDGSVGAVGDAPDTTSDTEGKRLGNTRERYDSSRIIRSESERTEREEWSEYWPSVAARLCGVDDGLPAELDEFECSKSKHRIERLKSLGNSIVPQVAMEIMKAMRRIDERWQRCLGKKPF